MKRELALGLGERWYNTVKGGVDSEWGFAVVLEELERRGVGVGEMMGERREGKGGAGPGIDSKVMREAVLGAIQRINALTKKAVEKAAAAATQKQQQQQQHDDDDDDDDEQDSIVRAGQDQDPATATAAAAVEPSSPLDPRSLLNFALTDGFTVICTRYISSRTDAPASLYFSSGTSWERATPPSFPPIPSSSSSPSASSAAAAPSPFSKATPPPTTPTAPPTAPPPGEYIMSRPTRASSTIIIASEPLTFERGDWVTVPVNSVLTVRAQNVLIHPIADEFYGGGVREGEGDGG